MYIFIRFNLKVTNFIQIIWSNQDLVVETGYFNRYMILAILFDGIFVNTKVFLNG